MTFFFLTTQYVNGQAITGVEKLYEKLKKSVDNKWIKENPILKTTNPSFFNKDNENKYFVGLHQISGLSVPFIWDNNLTLLHFLLTTNPDISVLAGLDADKIFKGTKIYWKSNINGLIWFNDKEYNATVDNWYFSDFTECPGTIIFPILSFKKVTDIPNALTNNVQGLMIIPYIDNLSIRKSDASLTDYNDNTVIGIAYDINNDGIFDIFSYTEELDETTFYTRLYINVSGEWKCKWINLDEACL